MNRKRLYQFLIVLILFVKNSKSPAALGNPYKKGER